MSFHQHESQFSIKETWTFSPDVTEQPTDQLFEDLNNYYKNIKLTCEVDPEKFLDTKLIRQNTTYLKFIAKKQK